LPLRIGRAVAVPRVCGTRQGLLHGAMRLAECRQDDWGGRDMAVEPRPLLSATARPGLGVCLTFELRGRQRWDARARTAKMYRVPPTGPWWPAAGAPFERVVRPRGSVCWSE
jgi:hypothetical protein